MCTLTRSSGELVLQSAWPLLVLLVQCLANVYLTSLSALYQLQGLIFLSVLCDTLRKNQTGSVPCLLMSGMLSAAGTGLKKFGLLVAIAHVRMDNKLT